MKIDFVMSITDGRETVIDREAFADEARAREMLQRRGWRVVEIAPAASARGRELLGEQVVTASARREFEATTSARAAELPLTTAMYFYKQRVTAELGPVISEVVAGVNLLKDALAQVRNVVGGRSATLEREIAGAREAALVELRVQAAALGADGIVALRLAYQPIHSTAMTMFMVAASGTAVRLEPRAD